MPPPPPPPTNNNVHTGQPEFKDPFAPQNSVARSFSSPMINPRPSMGSIAPNQASPSDDITSISQRLNTLTSSVGQLLQLQTQHIQGPPGLPGGLMGGVHPHSDLGPNPLPSGPHQGMLGHGPPPRQDMRHGPRPPNPPGRTWSTGNLEIPSRPSDPNIGRGDASHMLRDSGARRRSSALLRRDSAGVSSPLRFSCLADRAADAGRWRRWPPRL